MITTGLIIEKNRNAKNLSQKEFADLLEISQSHLSLVESNGKKPSQSLLLKIIEILGISEKEQAEIAYYEEFRKTPPVIRMKYFDLEAEISRLREQLEHYKELKDLDELLKERYLKK